MPEQPDKCAYPSLDPEGWILPSRRQADAIFSAYFCSDRHESTIHHGLVSSFASVLATFDQNVQKLINDLTFSLETLFSRYYPSVSVQVRDASDHPSQITLGIYVQIQTVQEESFTLYDAIAVEGSKFQRVLNALNTGVPT